MLQAAHHLFLNRVNLFGCLVLNILFLHKNIHSIAIVAYREKKKTKKEDTEFFVVREKNLLSHSFILFLQIKEKRSSVSNRVE